MMIWQFLQPVFANRDQIKVGFGLKNDAHLFRKKGILLNSVIELSKCFGSFGFKSPLGLKNAMALLFHVYFLKAEVSAPQTGHANSSVKHKLSMPPPMPTRLC